MSRDGGKTFGDLLSRADDAETNAGGEVRVGGLQPGTEVWVRVVALLHLQSEPTGNSAPATTTCIHIPGTFSHHIYVAVYGSYRAVYIFSNIDIC